MHGGPSYFTSAYLCPLSDRLVVCNVDTVQSCLLTAAFSAEAIEKVGASSTASHGVSIKSGEALEQRLAEARRHASNDYQLRCSAAHGLSLLGRLHGITNHGKQLCPMKRRVEAPNHFARDTDSTHSDTQARLRLETAQLGTAREPTVLHRPQLSTRDGEYKYVGLHEESTSGARPSAAVLTCTRG